MALKHTVKVLAGVFKYKKAVMGFTKKINVRKVSFKNAGCESNASGPIISIK